MPKSLVECAKGDQRVEIRLLFKEGKTQREIVETLQRLHGAHALSKSSVQRWITRIRDEGDDLSDKPHPGAPMLRTLRTATAQQKIAEDPRKSVRQLSHDLNLSVGATHKLLTKDMALKKKTARMVPHFLDNNQKMRRVQTCRDNLQLFCRRVNPVQWVVAQDESWFFTWDPASKKSNCEWRRAGEDRPTVVALDRFKPKCMLAVFINKLGIIHHEFTPRGFGISRIAYQGILDRFREAVRRKRPQLWDGTINWVLLHDGAPAHTAGSTVDFLRYHDISTLPHPPYSPDLNPCDYWFFGKMKKKVRGVRYPTVLALQQAIAAEMASISAQDFADVMDELPDRCRQIIASGGEYFERK